MRRLSIVLICAAVAFAGLIPTADAAVARRITVRVSASSVYVATPVTFSGSVSHTPKGGKVLVQRKTGTRWVTTKSTRTTNRAGAYRVRFAMPSSPALYAFRAFAPKTTRLRAAVSTIVKVRVQAHPVAPRITTASLTDAVAGQVYAATLAAAGNPAGTWAAGPLPAGLSVDSSTGAITGTPTATGTTQVTVGFTQTSTGLSAAAQLPLNVFSAPAVPVIILTSSLPDGQQNAAYAASLRVSANVAGTWTAAPLPAGLTVDPSTGAITGTPTATGTTHVTVGFTQASTGTPATAVQVPLTIGTVNPSRVQVSAGGTSTCRVSTDHTLWCWGYDDSGQLGDGGVLKVNPDMFLVPEQIGAATNWSAISVNVDGLPAEAHACGLRDTVGYCWGSGFDGALGDGNVITRTSPVAISGGYAWSQLSSGYTNTCGVTTGGALYCWGDDQFSQSATGGDTDVPTRVGTDYTWTEVSTGFTSSCAVKVDGTLWCWGMNSRGQLGIGTTSSQSAPTQVGNGTSWTQVSVGEGYACGDMSTGSVWCWGPSSFGQLGNGTDVNSQNTDELSPNRVGTGNGWVHVSAGRNHTCALNSAGTAWCWGQGMDGELGDGQGDGAAAHDATQPVQVGTSTDWESVASGYGHTCGGEAGVVQCWGSNGRGQLGINGYPSYTPRVNVPTAVVG